MTVIRGTFDVKITPQDDEFGISRLNIAKEFFGEMAGNGSGQMLAHRTATEGSAGYVAMEVVDVNIQGRSGGFAMQHFGLSDGGKQSQDISIVPGSGTGELAGISGTCQIEIDGQGKHFYILDYTLSA